MKLEILYKGLADYEYKKENSRNECFKSLCGIGNYGLSLFFYWANPRLL